MVAVMVVAAGLVGLLTAFLLGVFGKRRPAIALGGVAAFLLVVGVALGLLGEANAPQVCKDARGRDLTSIERATDRMNGGTGECPSSLLGVFDPF